MTPRRLGAVPTLHSRAARAAPTGAVKFPHRTVGLLLFNATSSLAGVGMERPGCSSTAISGCAGVEHELSPSLCRLRRRENGMSRCASCAGRCSGGAGHRRISGTAAGSRSDRTALEATGSTARRTPDLARTSSHGGRSMPTPAHVRECVEQEQPDGDECEELHRTGWRRAAAR